MAEAEQETSETFTLRYLGQVLDVLLDPSKKIIDDTSLQRLLEYCKTIFSHKDICKQEEGLKHVFDFLEACCVKEPHEFDPCALTFALQLVRCLSSNQDLLNHLTAKCDDQANSEGGSGGMLLVRLLKRASSSDSFSDPCMKEAWLIALHTLSYTEPFWTVCIQTDALRRAMDLLKDTSMFVVKSSQKFLARMLSIQYKQDPQKTSQYLLQEPKNAKSIDGQVPTNSQEMVPEGSQEGRSKMADSEGTIQDIQDITINGDNAGGDGGEAVKRKLCEVSADEELNSSSPKKSRLLARCDGDAESAIDLEVLQLCESVMRSEEAASILASLLLDLQTCDNRQQTVLQVSQTSESEMKTIQSLGVFRFLLKEASEGELESRGLHLLRDVTMAMRCKQLLCKEGQLCDKLCEDVVEFLGCLLQVESKKDTSLTASLILDVQSLPYELTKKGLVKPAIHLACSIVKLCSIWSQSSEPDAASAMKSSLSVIVAPACVIMEQNPLKTELTLDQDILQELRERVANGRQLPSILCTGLSALGDLVKEDCCLPCLPACSVFHLAVVVLHAFTPNAKKTIQSKGLIADYKSLIGSRKIVTSLLDLVQVSLTGACRSADTWLLVDIINTTLKNPDAEYQVILKILTLIPDLVAVAMETEKHPVAIENTKRDALMMEVGYALQKRMCNIEWEVRDSTIACVQKLLQKKSDTVKEWLKRNNLHKRLWESLADSESYVRSSSLQALPVLMSCKGLWDDVLSSSCITQLEVVAKVTEVIKLDSEAFPRRAAIGCLLTWLQHEPWMRDSFNFTITEVNNEKSSSLPSNTVGKVQDSVVVSRQGVGATDGESAGVCSILETDSASQEETHLENKVRDEGVVTVGEMINDAFSTVNESETPLSVQHKDSVPQELKHMNPEIKVRAECATLGEMVLDAISMATCDFDWEMKLRALEFFHLLMNRYVPGYESASTSSSLTSNCSVRRRQIKELCEEKEIKKVVSFFSRTGCLARLVQGSHDEDVSVARKACEMLQRSKVALGDFFEKIESSAQTCQEDRIDNSASGEDIDQCSVNDQTTATSVQNQDRSVTGTETLSTGTDEDTLKDGSNSYISIHSVCDLIGQLFESDWINLLKHREADNVEGPVSLMMDILAAADEKDENLLDCY